MDIALIDAWVKEGEGETQEFKRTSGERREAMHDQLYQNFAACRDLLRQEPVQAESVADLRQKLSVAAGGILFSTIQLFHTDDGGQHPVLTERGNVIVIADEAHRSQYGLQAKVDKATGELSYGFARNLQLSFRRLGGVR
jgi:type I restriction enzyme R subunit